MAARKGELMVKLTAGLRESWSAGWWGSRSVVWTARRKENRKGTKSVASLGLKRARLLGRVKAGMLVETLADMMEWRSAG